MNRRLYFTFDYQNDLWRANIVRNSWVTARRNADGFWDKLQWDSIKGMGDQTIKRNIHKALSKTSVTVVLIGQRTWQRKWIRYEIVESYRRGNGILGVHINDFKDQNGRRTSKGDNPFHFIYIENKDREVYFSELYKTYDWTYNNGFKNFGLWVEQADKSAITFSNAESIIEPKTIDKRRTIDLSEFNNIFQEFFTSIDFSPNASKRTLRVFLCHSKTDKPKIQELYRRLKEDNVDPWLDEEKLLPGQDWQLEIQQAVRTSDVVVVCLSHNSINKTGYVQKEIKFALDIADEQPEGAIYLIPVKLEQCDVPRRLQRWQWVDLFEKKGYDRLMSALLIRARTLEISSPNPNSRSAS